MNAATAEDFEDTEIRDQFGNPPLVKVTAAERAAQQLKIDVNNSRDHSVNKALPYVAFAWLLSGLAIGMVILVLVVGPAYIDSRVAAGVADSRAATAQQLADVKADMAAAKQNARLALDRADKIGARLEAKGLIKLENH